MLVTIFYNDVDLRNEPYVIHPNCPTINVPIEGAIEFAEKKLSSGEWRAYLIPDLTEKEFIYEL